MLKNKIVLIIPIVLILTSFTSCIFGEYRDTAFMVPADAQAVFNINLHSFFKRRAILSELEELKEDPSAREFLDNLQELAFTTAFSYAPEGIDLEKDLFPHLNTNFSAAFYEIGSGFSSVLNPGEENTGEKKFNLPYVIVFDIKDEEGVREFISKLNTAYNSLEKVYKEQVYHASEKSAYFINEHFFVISSNSELLERSIDCKGEISLSIVGDSNFTSFREGRMTDDSIGFLYWNAPSLSQDFLCGLPSEDREPWEDLLGSIHYMGTSIELDRNRLKFNTFLVHKDELSSIGKDFFSIPSKKLKSLEIFPENSSSVVVLGEPEKVLQTGYSLFKAFFPENVEKFEKFFTRGFGHSADNIFSSFTGEIALSFLPGKENEEESFVRLARAFSGNWILALELKEDSLFTKTLGSAENILSVVGQTDTYEDTFITSFPGRSISFTRLDEFFVAGFGDTQEHMRGIIDTFMEREDSVEERINPEISTEAVGIVYLNLYDLYSNNLYVFIEDPALREKLHDTFEKYPEVWGSINSMEKGYVSSLVMPF